jgi:hypothetical protein
MFKITKATETDVKFRTDAGTAIIKVRFLWLPASKRLAIIEAHDAEVAKLPKQIEPVFDEDLIREVLGDDVLPEGSDGKAPLEPAAEPVDGITASERAAALSLIHAKALVQMAEGWDLLYESGEAVPWTPEGVAQALDYMPGLWLLILMAAGEATSFKAIEGN